MKKRTLIQILLAVVIVGLGVWLYLSIMEPVKFDNEYTKRRDACAEKLKAIRTLEEAYKNTYGCFTGSFDTLFNRLLNEDSMKVVNKNINYDKIPEDVEIDEMTESDAIKAGYISRVTEYVNPIENLRKNKKFNLTDEEIMNLRYVPYPRDKKYEFDLQAGFIEKSGYQIPVFECVVKMEDLLADLDHQLVVNKLAELNQNHRFPGWKVGDMTQAITDGNFE
ncbi:MAG: hypothetical protein IJM33_06530 [Bacteroidales bacterium]|nr:hypothetical protein [Bacteroidales bacterium]MBR3412087.1 hypothetical protein [Bacteroidales bacterium]